MICGNNLLLEFWLSPKKKKGLCSDKGILFSLFTSKSHRSKRSANILVIYWLCAVNKRMAPRTAAAYNFWREIKMSFFWGRIKRRTLQKFSALMPEKILHFFALIGNTAQALGKILLACLHNVIFGYIEK